jgi:hypothetical protein
MRNLKGSANHLKHQIRKNFAKAFLCLIIFGLLFIILTLRWLSISQFDILSVSGLIITFVPLAAFYFYLRKYQTFRGGLEGEKRVAKLLSLKLSDEYYLINNLYMKDGVGDIDHIVLGPNGVFVLETKNWRGQITCKGDDWQRENRKFKGNPSIQVKRNVYKIKKLIASSPFSTLGIKVEGIVVFTNNNAQLHLTNPTVPILKLNQLPNYLTTTDEIQNRYSSQQLEAIGKEIQKQRR